MRYILTRFVFLATSLVVVMASAAEPGVVVDDTRMAPPPPASPSPAAPLPAWVSRVNAGAPGAIPAPRPFKAAYRLSWSDLDAAHAEANCTISPDGSQIVTRITGSTQGLARTLYQVDGTHVAIANRRTLHPVKMDQTELETKKRKTSHVEFNPGGAVRKTTIVDKNTGASIGLDLHDRSFLYPDMFDMHSALLYVRSLPLNTGDSRTLITMTAGSPYLATIKVVGRSTVKTAAGQYQAIECSITLSRINKQGELEPHKAFKSAQVWLSDDADRLIVKAEAQVFIGTVTLELTRVTFPVK